jgi:hypothetical protein
MQKTHFLMKKRSAQLLIALVAFFNLQCAIYFLVRPQDYAFGFELSGVAGDAMVRGMGLLFVMWNIPYLFALTDPIWHRISLLEAVLMQGVGVVGETVILLTLTGNHPLVTSTVTRFIAFDGGGFVLLLIALLLVRSVNKRIDSKL